MVRIFSVIFERKFSGGVPFFCEFIFGGGNIQVKQTLSIQVFAYHVYFIQEPPCMCEESWYTEDMFACVDETHRMTQRMVPNHCDEDLECPVSSYICNSMEGLEYDASKFEDTLMNLFLLFL